MPPDLTVKANDSLALQQPPSLRHRESTTNTKTLHNNSENNKAQTMAEPKENVAVMSACSSLLSASAEKTFASPLFVTAPYFPTSLFRPPQFPYCDATLRSLALSSKLTDLRLAASRYATGTFAPFAAPAFPDASRLLSGGSLQASPSTSLPPSTFASKFPDLFPRYDGRPLFMFPAFKDMLDARAQPISPTNHNSHPALPTNFLLSDILHAKQH